MNSSGRGIFSMGHDMAHGLYNLGLEQLEEQLGRIKVQATLY